MLLERIRRIANPLPEDQAGQGFKPNRYIRFLRLLSDAFIKILRLRGDRRFGNEFIQKLDPVCPVVLPDGTSLWFRTGHGRLLWRARTFLEEEPMLVEWIYSFQESDCFYDIGANVGSYSLIAANRGVHTIAIEAELLNASLLYENIHLNGLHAVCMPIPFALGRETKLDRFFINHVSKGDALHGLGAPSYLLADPEATIEVPAISFSLDDLISTFKLSPPTKLKLDVDSNELDILLGAENTLKNAHEIYVEVDSEYENHKKIIEFLGSLGFEVAKMEPIPRQWRPTLNNCLFRRQ